MSDKEARVLGAGDTLTVKEKEFRILPIGMQQLTEVQRHAVAYYKREYLRTFAENLDLFPAEKADGLLEQKLEEVARWDVGDLPVKMSYDVSSTPIDTLSAELTAIYGELPAGEFTRRALLATALDSGKITPDTVEAVSGIRPGRARVPYDTWWITAVYDGMITFVWASMKISHPELTKKDISNWSLAKIIEAARMVERLTAPALGNM